MYRMTLYNLTLSRLLLDESLAHVYSGRARELLGRLFNQTSFALGGRGRQAGPDSVRISLDQSAENVRVLAAARWFRDHGHFDPHAGRWPWPDGYDPQNLMVELETRLDDWAGQVRERFLAVARGSEVASNALGLRVVALAAIGHDINALRSASAVLGTTEKPFGSSSDVWRGADAEARSVLGLPTHEYIGEFAAVRQGARGEPQLVDALELQRALESFIADPVGALEAAASSDADAGTAVAARNLLSAMNAAADAEAEGVTSASSRLVAELEGLAPKDVAEQALEVAQRANERGLFRPADAWGKFRAAIDVLDQDNDPVISVLKVGRGVREVLLTQHAGRRLQLLDAAVGFVRKALAATRDECLRSGTAVGDLAALRDEVKAQVEELDQTVQGLARKE